MAVLRCRYPFPHQDPPVDMPEACSAKCPNYDAETLAARERLKVDDPELLEAIRSFADWFYVPGQDVQPQVDYAATLYTRRDHSGTCIPKTILFAHYKGLQYGGAPDVRETTLAAARGEAVASWPDGEIASGTRWNEMFGRLNEMYDAAERW